MNSPLTRREFLQTSIAAAGLSCSPAWMRGADGVAVNGAFSFVLLGDLHFDKLEHHNMAWVQKEKPNDVGQIQNYSRITRDVTPKLFATVRNTVAELNRSPATRVAFVLQVGDLVEGLCGSEELALRQNSEALAFVREAKLGTPFLFAKGNHDITGPGAVSAFSSAFHPFLSEQVRSLAPSAADIKRAHFTVDHGNALFAFFDAYDAATSLAWFEAVAARRTAEHLFVVVHPPVVPYGARSTWHVFSAERDRTQRAKFLALLGAQHAIVLGGHIHRFNMLARAAGSGQFSQFALSSILSTVNVQPKTTLLGLEHYTPDQISVEPNFSPGNAAERRAVYETERPFVRAFEYADLPGYAIVTVAGDRVTARMFSGAGREVWRATELNPAHLARG